MPIANTVQPTAGVSGGTTGGDQKSTVSSARNCKRRAATQDEVRREQPKGGTQESAVEGGWASLAKTEAVRWRPSEEGGQATVGRCNVDRQRGGRDGSVPEKETAIVARTSSK